MTVHNSCDIGPLVEAYKQHQRRVARARRDGLLKATRQLIRPFLASSCLMSACLISRVHWTCGASSSLRWGSILTLFPEHVRTVLRSIIPLPACAGIVRRAT